MKLSTRVRYGSRAMVDLAQTYGNGPVLLKDIAKRQEISLKYLDRILASLKAGGLVKTARGSKGGYALNRPPSKITLRHIAQALEGPLELVECIHNKNYCHRINACVMNDIWRELNKTMEAVLERQTLEDLVNRSKEKKKRSKMYYI